MESRRDFVRGTALAAGAVLGTALPAAQPAGKARYLDKLTDDTGK